MKFLGCGLCDNFSRSTSLADPTADPRILARECIVLLNQMNVPPTEIRGVGVQVHRLEPETSVCGPSLDLTKWIASNKLGALMGASRNDDLPGPSAGVRLIIIYSVLPKEFPSRILRPLHRFEDHKAIPSDFRRCAR